MQADDRGFLVTFPDPNGQLSEFAGRVIQVGLGTSDKIVHVFVNDDPDERRLGQDHGHVLQQEM
jgi:hypothetical protein